MSPKADERGQVRGLFNNAVQSIQLGIEDYQANNPKRAVSAVRNFYAGVLLLAKEVLVRQVPDVDPKDVIGARYKPVPGDDGGIAFTPASQQTIDFATIGERFKDFGLAIDHGALNDLNRIRNDLEHYFTDTSHEAVREAIAKAFPVVAELCRQIDEAPHEALGEAWQVMLDARGVYERELAACRQTFENVDWPVGLLAEARLSCPECQSDLVAQQAPENTHHQSLDCRCRLCGHGFSAEQAIEQALETYFETESYVAMTDGGDQPVLDCPECGLATYLLSEEHVGCVWCGLVLGECGRCMEGLTPDNVSPDNLNLCSYCNHLMQKDD